MKAFRSTADDYYDNPMDDYPLPTRIFYDVVIWVLFLFSKAMWRWKMEHPEPLQRTGEKGSVVISNHTSMAEVITIVCHIRRSGGRVRPIMKSEFNKNALVKWFFARVGGIPVERGTADMTALRRAQHALQRGEHVLIFPEGTRIRTDDQPVTVHGGFAIIAQMAKADIIPMAVCGFRDITKNGSHLMRPVKTWMRCGDPLALSEAPADLKRKERLQWVEDEALRRMYAIRDEMRVEHPGRR